MEQHGGCNCRAMCLAEPSNRIGVGKNTWPELVGVKGEIAAATIHSENPTVRAIIVSPGMGMQQDLRSDRVWVLVDINQIVTCIPFIG
ncbi:hypothetical protein RND81_10G240800 [Saponaria officinalis]|uniref:Uncharacterized protein n=1 Tax=Saponaria officinalis TaxID=3572 RepID=A0AAW1I806_SAPOF